ncbi:MAG: alpha-amylase family glycosyl hydrolase, partial [Oscillospiraceae bacterium]|nr:alpha-amylase family glycosyl hydrolase [Oscillospiraceae bacterium]
MSHKRTAALLLCLCLLASLLAGCAQTAPTPSLETAERNVIDDKYRNWYEIFVYSFHDSDGDRIGDINGLTEKLDYVAALGANGIWLMPIMPSPSYHKYDVTDYYGIDPQYGTLEDFRAFLDAAHGRGIDVIIDLVVNHTSNEHPWFQSAKQGEDSPYRDYYVWGGEARSGYSRAGDSYYESRFVSTMPDLNLDSEAVRGEITDIMRFWLEDVGVDGFRLDAVTSYYTGVEQKNIDFLTWLGETARGISPDCYIVGEAWEDLYTIADYAGAGIDSFFTFPVS